MIDNEFETWFSEMEGYSFRSERFYDDFDYAAKTGDYEMIVKWLQAAFKAAKENQRD